MLLPRAALKQHADQLDALAATEKHGNLVRSPSPPQPYATLIRRMVVFLFSFRAGLSRHFWQAPIDQTLADHVSQEAADVWRELEVQTQ